jgi:hypothetical protein
MIKFATVQQGPSCGRSFWKIPGMREAAAFQEIFGIFPQHFISHMWLQDTHSCCGILAENQALLEEKACQQFEIKFIEF